MRRGKPAIAVAPPRWPLRTVLLDFGRWRGDGASNRPDKGNAIPIPDMAAELAARGVAAEISERADVRAAPIAAAGRVSTVGGGASGVFQETARAEQS